MKVAIVTGASSGLGKEFVKRLGKRKDIDELWVIARRKERLEELSKEVPVPVKPIPMDLTSEESIEKMKTILEFEKPNIRFLVNAAGLGKIGFNRDLTIDEQNQMIDLNCRAAVDMTMLCLPYMFRRSRIINICSVAGFQPLVGLGTYAASKAFLLNWTKSLHYELIGTGIHVTAVCPYWVKDTEFIPVAQDTPASGDNEEARAKSFSLKKPVIRHFPLASKTPSVVSWALGGSALNMWVTSTSPVAVVQRFLTWQLPDFMVVPIWDVLRRL